MRVLPASGCEWVALSLLPFKIFAPFGWLTLAIKREMIGYRMDFSSDLAVVVLLGDMLSFFILVLGAVIQRNVGPRRAYFSTCGFILALFIFGWLTLPYLAHT